MHFHYVEYYPPLLFPSEVSLLHRLGSTVCSGVIHGYLLQAQSTVAIIWRFRVIQIPTKRTCLLQMVSAWQKASVY